MWHKRFDLNSKLLSINLRSQHLDKKRQEVKNVVKQPTQHGTCILKSLQNFRVKKRSISLNNTSQIYSVHAITPVLPTKEPEYSLSMRDEHLSTTSETKSDEVTKSSVKNLVPIPSEYKVTFDDESEYDVPVKDESSLIFTTFSNPIFDDNDDFTSKINSNMIDPHYFNAKSDLIESLSNRDTLFDSYSKFDYLEEFSGKLMLPSIKSDDYDSGGDIHIFEELLSNDTPPIPENESSNINHHHDPSFPHPPLKPSDVEVFFEPDSGVLTTNVVKVISEHYVIMPNILSTLPTFDPLYPVYDTLPPFSLENEDKVFKPGILSYLLISHQDKTISDFSENPLMMYGGDIPLLDV
nr:hypothetical protein [Tanacetum cinerariifolium]